MLLDMTTNAPRTPRSKAPSANMPTTPTVTPPERPRWSASEAAKRCGVGRATILRAITDGRIVGAEQGDQGWSIPLEGLLAAGFTPDRPTPDRGQVPDAPAVPDHRDQTIYELRAELAAERVRADAAVTLADAYNSHLQTALRMIEGSTRPADLEAVPVANPSAVVANPPAPVAKPHWWSRT